VIESVGESLVALQEAIDRLADPGSCTALAALPTPAPEERRWAALGPHVAAQLAGLRVLDVGRGDGHDAFQFAARGAEHVLACTAADVEQGAGLADSADKSRIEFRRSGWEGLDPVHDGKFDLVHCHGLLHRVLEPIALLRTLRRMTAPNGELLISSMVLADPERSEFLRFVPDRHVGGGPFGFVPGRLAFRWLVEAAGFDVEAEFGETEGPRERFPVLTEYLRARAVD
jgi:tRNA (mo5U34)-methyltransferase